MRFSTGSFLVAVILVFSVSVAFSLDPSVVVGVWTFDADGDMSDISGNGHDGEADGNVEWTVGKFGLAVELDGNSAIVIEHDDGLNLETFTLVAWVNIPTAPVDWWTIIAKDGWPDRNYGVFLASGTGLAHHSFSSGGAPDNNMLDAVTPVQAGDWYHVTATYDLEISRLYINGVLDAEASFKVEPNTTDVPVIIGRTPTDTYKYVGLIDEVAIFSVALGEADINDIMTKGLSNVTAVSPQVKR